MLHIEPLIGEAEQKAVAEYLQSGGFLTEFKKTEEFEGMLADYLSVPYVSCVPNGTSALYLALLAAGVGAGDEVLVPDLTMIATPNAVRMVGATPILIDVDEKLCMDTTLNAKVNNLLMRADTRVKAMIYVDFNGRSTDMNKVREVCKYHGITLIEDACQALGSEFEGKKLGTFGRFGCFSLGFHKIITTGQGGFLVSQSKADYEAIEKLKDFGRLHGGNDVHDTLGFNFKFTDLQAVIGIEQLKTIDWRIQKKRQLYKWYYSVEAPEGYVPWFLEDFFPNRDEIAKALKDADIETRPLYPPIHTQSIYKDSGFPNATQYSEEGLWLPSSLSLDRKDIIRIKEVINEAV